MCFLLAFAGVASAQTVEIKGHAFGETITEFIRRTPGGEAVVQACRESVTPKIARKLKVNDAWCHKQLLPGVDDGESVTLGFGDTESDGCFAGMAALAPCDRKGKVLFQNRKMIKMTLTLLSDYADVLKDMVIRLGEPTKTTETVAQNGYGATFHDPTAYWASPSFIAFVDQRTEFLSGVGYYKEVEISIQTPEYLQTTSGPKQDTLK